MSRWVKSSFCGPGSCVEVHAGAVSVQVRDSKLGQDSPVLTFSLEEWEAFLRGVKAGEFSPT